uniref:MATH domain-containing protein n=1 Tax=Populus trichocarpa TaxID=3694 RepID=B9MWX1_POPTR
MPEPDDVSQDQIDQRFPKTKMEWGFIESLSHDAFRDPSNGFLVNDLCIFAVEVFAIKSSALDKHAYYSEVITVEGRNWYMSDQS